MARRFKGRKYPDAIREKALAIAEETTAVQASRELGIPVATIYTWRQAVGQIGPPRGERDPDAWARRKEEGAAESWEEARAALQLVRQRLGDGEENKAKTAALTFAILADKSAMLEQSSALAAERNARIDAAQIECIAEALSALLTDLDLPKTAAVAEVMAHHLRPLEDPGADTGPSEHAATARSDLATSYRDAALKAWAVEAEQVEDAEVIEVEPAEAEQVEVEPERSDEPSDPTCPTCGESIPAEDRAAHLAGLDETRPSCARFDHSEINEDSVGGPPSW